MAKLSDLFGRKLSTAGPDNFTGRSRNGNGNGSDHISIESLSDVGSRIGEENEVLRLTDTGRKINELEDLKDAFDKLVAPFNSTLRALKQEKSQNMSLSGMLTEARTSYETLRTEFYQIERKSTVLEAGGERLRADLELARETGRALESARLELTDDLNARHAQINELLSADARIRAAPDGYRSPSGTAGPIRYRGEAHNRSRGRTRRRARKIGPARRREALFADCGRSSVGETARLTRRLIESENTLTATRAQLGKVESSFAEAYAERGRLSAVLDEAKEQHQAERSNLNMRLDALQSRATTAERLLSEARQNLIARTEEVRVRPKIGRGNDLAQQFRKAAGADRSRTRGARTTDQRSRASTHRADRTQ